MNCYFENGIYEIRYILKNTKINYEVNNESVISDTNSNRDMIEEKSVPKENLGTKIKKKFFKDKNK